MQPLRFVLVVTEEELIANLITRTVLAERGERVVLTASSQQEALTYVREQPLDLVVLDMSSSKEPEWAELRRLLDGQQAPRTVLLYRTIEDQGVQDTTRPEERRMSIIELVTILLANLCWCQR